MHRLIISLLTAVLALALVACAATPKKVEMEKNEIPAPAKGEVAVFGKVRLVEYVGRVHMPAQKLKGNLYLKQDGSDNTYRVHLSNSGEFGVYLPAGAYKVVRIMANGYLFEPESLALGVPSGAAVAAVYAGTVSLDGTPSGVEPDSGHTVFVYSVKDEYRQFVSGLKITAPGAESQVTRSLFVPANSIATGTYPVKVFRAEDVGRSLKAKSDDLEEVVAGVIIALPYVINPLWIFTKP
jgi:hypothetical protein